MFKLKETWFIILGLPATYMMLAWTLFGIDTWASALKVMSLSFLFFVPTVTGALVMYFSRESDLLRPGYRWFAPLIPVLLFFLITICFSLEGLACWIMILPLFMIASWIGGRIGLYLRKQKKGGKLYVSLLVFIPFILSPVEQLIGAIPGTYRADTAIDIRADAASIWKNVTRVKTIAKTQDKGWLTSALGFPRPLKAELNYDGVGGYRKAIFSGGLIFDETVLEYQEKKKMVFSIKANPHDIPAATMDEHVVIGGEFFDVLNGTYELEKIDDHIYRLHLYSHFKMKTTFNFYAGLWAGWIMKDIQNNILQVIKSRAESSAERN